MTEKRFTLTEYYFWDKGKPISSKEVLDLLNSFNEQHQLMKSIIDGKIEEYGCLKNVCNTVKRENEELKQTVQRLKDNIDELLSVRIEEDLLKENEELKQFQDRVFSWIDMHLQRLPTLIDEEFNSDNEFADPSLYSGALQILETMKKELKGDVE